MGIFHWVRGTLEQFWNLGGAGQATNPALRRNGAALEVRLGNDSAFAVTRGAAPVGPDDYTQKAYVDAAVAALLATIGTVSAAIARVASLAFGNNTTVPSLGSVQLRAPGDSLVGYRVTTAGTISRASLEVNLPDAVRSYVLDIRVNGLSVATVPLPATSTGAHSAALANAVVAGDRVTTFIVLTAGVGASTFTQETAFVGIS